MPDASNTIAVSACLERARVEFDPDSGAEPVPSPCSQVCRISDATGWCEGCQRRREEIAAWRKLGDDDKRVIWRRIHARRAGLGDGL